MVRLAMAANGGPGGDGGASGGGAGGILVGVLWQGTEPQLIGEAMIVVGAAGEPGVGAVSGMNDAVAGAADSVMQAP